MPAFVGAEGSSVGGAGGRVLRRRSPVAPRLLVIGFAFLSLLGVILCSATPATAASKAVFGKFCTPGTASENKGGQCRGNKGMSVNHTGAGGATAGDVYIAEGTNHRIQQFSASGSFVRAFGVDVIASGKPGDLGTTTFEICMVAADCKAGVASPSSGGLSLPWGVAVDQISGAVFVADRTNRRISIFSATGSFQGAFGWNVAGAGDPGDTAPTDGFEFCKSVCQAGPPVTTAPSLSESAGAFASTEGSLQVAPTSRHLYVPDNGNSRINEFSLSFNPGGEVIGASFVRGIGWDVIPLGQPGDTGAGLETCTTATTCRKGLTGGPGQFASANNPGSIAVDNNGYIYTANFKIGITDECTPELPCGVLKFNPDGSFKEAWGPSAGECQLTYTSGGAQSVEVVDVAVNPNPADSDNRVFVLKKTGTTSVRVYELDEDGSAGSCSVSPAGAAITASAPVANRGLAVGDGGLVFAHISPNPAGPVSILGTVPPSTVHMDPPVTEITASSAKVEGTVSVPAPGGEGFDTSYYFEYSSDGGESWLRAPATNGSVGSVAGSFSVSEELKELLPNTTYLVRLIGITGDLVASDPISFKTLASSPTVTLTYPDEVTPTSAELGAHVNPGGVKSSYYFEWGPTEAYGNRVPATFDRQLGAGTEELIAKEAISGLSPGTKYHFRIVVTNSVDTVVGQDRVFETLNSCGLTNDRCFELVSPPDKGPVSAAGDLVSLGQELQFQAAPAGSAIEYVLAYGLPNSTAGGEVTFKATRDSAGWSSSQLGAPALISAGNPEAATPSRALGLSADLSCGAFASTQPLTPDTPSGPLINSKANLFRRGSDGTWTVITKLEPINAQNQLALFDYNVIGLSESSPLDHCQRVVFRGKYQYPGIGGTGEWRLYEWDNGTLSNVGLVPGPSGEEVAETVAGASSNPTDSAIGAQTLSNYWNAVSDDASRIYFTAVSKAGGDIGHQAVFLRENGSTVDVSQSKTATPNNDASVYQTASADGSKVFFTARYGLAANGSSTGASSCGADGAGCDLYEYSVEDETLTDLSVDTDGSGAGVVGVLDASDDGDYVYFAARGQLVAGEGSVESVNVANDTYSVYLAHAGSVEYVGRIEELDGRGALIGSGLPWTSRATPDGKHLLFESRTNVNGYDSGEKIEGYIYDAATATTECVSCRRDQQESVAVSTTTPLISGLDVENKNSPPLTITDDGERVFFISVNRLAVGATAGKRNLYQWENGQITFIADSEPAVKYDLRFAGASASGDDLYFTTVDQLTWEDTDAKLDVYDARVGGGFVQPQAPPAPCNPLTEGGCQGSSTAPSGTALVPSSSTFAGPGNEAPPPKKAKKKKKKSGKKGKKKSGKGKNGKNKARNANNDRRAGK